ncbi:MAG: hypothetical protein P8P74_12875 [Crocinitomicaceae bacterium]|nr:hypothetical protein [Crocinitomicaceae bacterium]
MISCGKDTIENNGDADDSCLYDAENYSAITDPSFSESGLIPMHLENYWRYADSTWDAGGNLIESGEFVIQPSAVGTYGNEVWWETNFYPIQVISVQDECLFDLQANIGPCPEKNLTYVLFNLDSITLTTSIWGDNSTIVAAHKVSSISTPAGTFIDCFHYDKFGYDATTLKHGIGIIEWTAGFENNSVAGRKLTLIEYHLE